MTLKAKTSMKIEALGLFFIFIGIIILGISNLENNIHSYPAGIIFQVIGLLLFNVKRGEKIWIKIKQMF